MKALVFDKFKQLGKYDVLALTVLSFVIKLLYLRYFDGPLIFKDELYYRQNALAIFQGLQYATPHYPPMYPLALAPAFLSSNWYGTMLAINAFLSSMLIPATWFLGRTLDLRRPSLAALLAALLPMHVVYPRFVMSENLFVPLFVMAVALALRGGRNGRLESCLFGATLGAAHLTKYLFLPAVPVLFSAWALAFFVQKENVTKINKTRFLYCILYALIAYGLVFSAWIYYGYASGFEWKRLLGFGISGERKFTSTAYAFYFWFIAYLSYACLMAIPPLILCGSFSARFRSSKLRFQFSKTQILFFVLLVCFAVGYCLVAANHSFCSKYNNPVPQYILGRYLMHISPLILCVFVLLLDLAAMNVRHHFSVKSIMSLAFVVVLMGLSWGVLFNDMIVDVSPWFSKLTFNAVDVFNFDSGFFLSVFIFCSFIVIILLRSGITDTRLLIAPICLGLFMNYVISYKKIIENNEGIHARMIFSGINSLVQSRKTINVAIDSCPVSYKDLLFGLKFHNISGSEINVNFYNELSGVNLSSENKVFLLTSYLFNINDEVHYRSSGRDFSFFEADCALRDNLKPRILEVQPAAAVAGVAFNKQLSGNSALGILLSSSSSQTVLKFADHELPLARGQGGFASAEIPSQYLSSPGILQLRLVDKFTGLESDVVEFQITQL